jgi:hypothetical protein
MWTNLRRHNINIVEAASIQKKAANAENSSFIVCNSIMDFEVPNKLAYSAHNRKYSFTLTMADKKLFDKRSTL